MNQLEYIESVFDVCWKADNSEMVFWRPWPEPDGPWRAFALCSDWFAWASADAEEITPEDIPMLYQCLEDCKEIEKKADKNGNKCDQVATAYIGELFACRKRQMHPMKCVYTDKNSIGPLLAEIFDKAGPPREDSEGKR